MQRKWQPAPRIYKNPHPRPFPRVQGCIFFFSFRRIQQSRNKAFCLGDLLLLLVEGWRLQPAGRHHVKRSSFLRATGRRDWWFLSHESPSSSSSSLNDRLASFLNSLFFCGQRGYDENFSFKNWWLMYWGEDFFSMRGLALLDWCRENFQLFIF